jgi:hypothetical protein
MTGGQPDCTVQSKVGGRFKVLLETLWGDAQPLALAEPFLLRALVTTRFHANLRHFAAVAILVPRLKPVTIPTPP